MTVTFIAHSAYLVEWDKFYTLFDYTYEPDYTGANNSKGTLPKKRFFSFRSNISARKLARGGDFVLLQKKP
jgi:hypothetical protein